MEKTPPASKHIHEKIKIAISGAAKTDFLPQGVLDSVEIVGGEIARQGAIMISGATTGIPLWAAKGCKDAGGFSIGISPAFNEAEHVDYYGLPLDYLDLTIYTGLGYPGRDILMIRTADAIVIGPGRVGTLHEFTVAFEDNKPIGILTSSEWETDDIIKLIIEKSHRAEDNKKVIYDADPKKLVKRLIDLIKIDKAAVHEPVPGASTQPAKGM
ncbi:MAG: hypothetical protein WC764_03515 [Candidatus Paceibacterota bacterium]|jgi:hypothetical protein